MDNYWWPYGTVSTTEPETGDGVNVTRDDLIRLVVGMQWREACMTAEHYCYNERGGFWPIDMVAMSDLDGLVPATTVVDEWLGVQ